MNYSCYRLNSFAEFDALKVKFEKSFVDSYTDKVYDMLLKMQPNSFFSVENSVSEGNRELFIKICCMFIQEGNSDYVFSADYKMIIRK